MAEGGSGEGEAVVRDGVPKQTKSAPTAGNVQAGQTAPWEVTWSTPLALWRLYIEGEPPKVGKQSSKRVLLLLLLNKLLIISGLSGRPPVERNLVF